MPLAMDANLNELTRYKQANTGFIGWFFFANTGLVWLLGFGYLKAILWSGSLFQNSVADYTSFFGRAFVLAFTVVNYLSFMMCLTFLPALVVWLVNRLFPSRRLITGLSILFSSIGLVFILVDVKIYDLYKFHFNSSLLSLMLDGYWRDVFDFSTRELVVIITKISVIVCLESLIAYVLWQKYGRLQSIRKGGFIASLAFGSSLFSYLTLMLSMTQSNNLFSQQLPSLPFYNQLMVYLLPEKNAERVLAQYTEHHYAQPFFSNAPLNYPQHPMQCNNVAPPYNIILIMVDSLRADSIQKNYMPHVTEFSRQSWAFLKHLSGGNATQPGLFSLFYSIPSTYWTAALQQKKPPILFNLLRDYHYQFKLWWSAEMMNPPFHKTIFLGLHGFNPEGAGQGDIAENDRFITQKAIHFLTTRQGDRPFFMNLFYDAPHGYCREQRFPLIFKPASSHCSRITMDNNTNPLPYYHRYLNAVRFVDTEVGMLLRVIEERGYLTNSIVIITSDHGQAFNENHQNDWGHAGYFTNAQVHIPLVIHWPLARPKQVGYQTSSYDVIPTLAQGLFGCKNARSDYSIGQHLLKQSGRLPFVLSGSYVNMGIIEPNRLTTLETSGRVRVTTRESVPLPNTAPSHTVLAEALRWMRVYFVHNPISN